MSSSPSRVEHAEIVLSDSDTKSVLSVSATNVPPDIRLVSVLSANRVTVDIVESGSGDRRGITVASVGDRARISNLVATPFCILSFTTGE